ncbi:MULTISPECIES: hypothetical protein [Janibacter]|uniref:hypothetical protein n=1 Tax=Janibacter TaxID=53457 RepID=UPI0021A50CAD|nr:hypothetical protein [Janibacter hoylei]MCT1618824.1 hypothetical protein [Janibacter hoylei]MCT2291638.1 hypothetical protein [Janibacter hoylei]
MSQVNLSALTTEALKTSGVLWLQLPGRERLTWFATGQDELAGQVLVVSGGPEADLGPLPEQLRLVLRSKGDGGRLLTLHAAAQALSPGNPWWETAATTLLGERLNAPADLLDRWRAESTIWLLSPFGTPVQAPGRPEPEGDARVAGPVTVGAAGTRVRRPWHLGGRGRG